MLCYGYRYSGSNMKTVILGMIGGFLIIYTTVTGLTVYEIQSRENEVQNALSEIVVDTLSEYYVPEFLRDSDYEPKQMETIELEICEELSRRISSDSRVEVTIIACDMDTGILSVRVDEAYQLPDGSERVWAFAKTAIVDQERKDGEEL